MITDLLLRVHAWIVVRADVIPNPAPQTPSTGGDSISNLLGYARWGSLACCGLAAVIAGGMLALGNLSQRPHMTERGKTTLVYSVLGAVVVGGGIPVINMIFNQNNH